jgi:hypothetical protein
VRRSALKQPRKLMPLCHFTLEVCEAQVVLSPSCGDTSLLAFPHLRLSHDLSGDASLGVAATVGPVVSFYVKRTFA